MIKWNTAYQIDNVLCANLVKVSILLFVLRMQNSKTIAFLIWTVMSIMSAVNLVTLAIFAPQCRPLAKLWNITLPGVCSDHSRILQIGYAQGVVNVLTDLFCTMTPTSNFCSLEGPDQYTIGTRDMRSDESWPHSYSVTDCPGHRLEHSFREGLLAYVVRTLSQWHHN